MGSGGVKSCSGMQSWGRENPDLLVFWAFPQWSGWACGSQGERSQHSGLGDSGRETWTGVRGYPSRHFSSLPSPLRPVLPPSGCGLKGQDSQAAAQSTVEREGKARARDKAWKFQTSATWERRKSFLELSRGDGVGA